MKAASGCKSVKQHGKMVENFEKAFIQSIIIGEDSIFQKYYRKISVSFQIYSNPIYLINH